MLKKGHMAFYKTYSLVKDFRYIKYIICICKEHAEQLKRKKRKQINLNCLHV